MLVKPQFVGAAAAGFLLSFVFVGSNFFAIKYIEGENGTSFMSRFYLSIAVRFILVLAALAAILAMTKINEIYFTVSFIISYIFHSVIEVMSINKLLETDN